MDLLKQKTLIVGNCVFYTEEVEAGPVTTTGYFFDVNGVPCSLTFAFWSDRTWRLIDRLFGVELESYETFQEAADAVRDGAWVRTEHEKMLADNPAMAAPDAVQDLGDELFRVDNPLKGRPGITLIPNPSSRHLRDHIDDPESEDEEWDDEDWDDNWDDEDWVEVIDEADTEAAALTERISEDAVSDTQSLADSNSDETADADEDGDDWTDDSDDEDWEDDEYPTEITLASVVPCAAYIVDINRSPVAIHLERASGAIAWWELFDVQTGIQLWYTHSISEAIRIAPLMLVPARNVPEISTASKQYINALILAFDGSKRQKFRDYINTGYIKATGQEYLDLINSLFMDPLSLDNVWTIESYDEDEPDDE